MIHLEARKRPKKAQAVNSVPEQVNAHSIQSGVVRIENCTTIRRPGLERSVPGKSTGAPALRL